MKRLVRALSLIAVSLCLPHSARAQMGMDMFKKPTFTKVFNPVVGKGAEYQTTRTDSKNGPRTMQMFIVGKESVDGKDGYWMEIVSATDKGGNFVGKTLFTKDDFEFRRMVIQMPGQDAMGNALQSPRRQETKPPGHPERLAFDRHRKRHRACRHFQLRALEERQKQFGSLDQ